MTGVPRNCLVHLAPLFFALATLLCATCRAQILPSPGQNAVIKDTGGDTANSASILDATQFAGADPCVQIQTAFATLPHGTAAGTIDARGLIPGGVSTTLTCSVNPLVSSGMTPTPFQGTLLLGAATYLAQVPWVIGGNQLNIVGVGPGNSIIRPCKSGQALCGGMVFPSGQAVIQMGTSTATVFGSTVKGLTVNCSGAPGVSGIQAVAAQEETGFDLITVQDCPAASFDLGLGDTAIQNGAALSNFHILYTSGSNSGCGSGVNNNILSVSRSGNTVTAILTSSPATPPAVGQEVWIQGVTDSSYNGYYRINSTTSSTTSKYQTNASGGSSSSGGTASFWPVGVRVWQMSGSGVRPIVNGTIDGSKCSSFAPIAMELSGGDPHVHNVHTEGFTTGFQLGDLSGTNSATLTSLRPDNNTVNGVVISNQYQTSGGLPGALPTGNVNIFNLDATGGCPVVTDSLVDQINNNTLTEASNGTVSSYVFGPNGVFTTAVPESGLQNAVDISGQNVQVFSGSSTAAFSAAAGAVAIGASAGASGLSINGGTPITSYIDGSQSINFGTISAQSCTEVTVTVTGAATTNQVSANPKSNLGNNILWDARVSAANTVAVRACNITSSSFLTSSAAWSIKVFQ